MIRRYVHLGTGNYNDRTARLYGDFGYFTCDEKFGEDVTNLFNIITGYARPPAFHHVAIAPTGLRGKLMSLIQREIEHARAGRLARMGLADVPRAERMLAELGVREGSISPEEPCVSE